MSRSPRWIHLFAVVSLASTLGAACSNSDEGEAKSATTHAGGSTPAPVDWAAVEAVFSRKAEVTGDVHRLSFPRSDLTVNLGDVTLKPGFALGSYAAFVPAGDGTMVMGDLVLAEPEVNGVMTKLQQQGLEVTGLHNHLIGEQPKVMYLHYDGFDKDAVGLAKKLRTALEASATPLGVPPTAPADQDLGFAPDELDRILGRPGKVSGGLYKQSIGRAEPVSMHVGPRNGGARHQVTLTPATGVATVINFQPLGGGRAAVTGDFALLGSEVGPVSSALTQRGVTVTAVHSHVTEDQPTIYYMHFFASGPATQLAEGLRAALDLTNSAKA